MSLRLKSLRPRRAVGRALGALAVGLLNLGWLAAARADVKLPDDFPRKPPASVGGDAVLELVLKADGGAPVLEVPRRLIPAASGVTPASDESKGFSALFGDNGRALFAGLALAVGAALAGFWLLRRQRLPRAARVASAAGAAALLCLAGLATTGHADLLPFGGRPRPPSRELPPGQFSVTVKVVERGDHIRLHVDADTAYDFYTQVKRQADVKVGRPAPSPESAPRSEPPR